MALVNSRDNCILSYFERYNDSMRKENGTTTKSFYTSN